MGQSTDGQLCFGVFLPEGEETVFDGWEYLSYWWVYEVNGFNDGKSIDSEGSKLSYADYEKFLKDNPPPVEMVNVCSCDYPIYIYAIPSSIMVANRGYPESFNPSELTYTLEEQLKFNEFLTTYTDLDPSEAKWYLSSLWC